MNTKVIRYLFVALVVSSMSACVPMWTGDEMRQEIDAIRAEQDAMQENYEEEKTRLTEMIASARQDVSELQNVLKEARALLQRNNADLGVEIQNTREEIAQLRGEIEQLEFKVAKIDESLQLFKEDVDLRFEERNVALPEQPVPLFEHAKKAFDEGNYRQARRAFEKFRDDFASHGKAAEAQYFLGQTYFKQDQWVNSVSEFKVVVANHDKSTRVDDAIYHIGAALVNMGRCDQAKGWFELVIEEYGNSEWISNARQQLNAAQSGCS